MNQNNIEEYNRLCAEFLGWERQGNVDYYKTSAITGSYWGGCGYTTSQMHFHSDWNWIFPVVEALEDEGYWVEISGGNHPREESRIYITTIKSGMVPVFRGEAVYRKKSVTLAIWNLLASHNGKPHYEQPAIKETTQLPGIDPSQVIPSDPMTVKETTV
jgi:hypothetical protein